MDEENTQENTEVEAEVNYRLGVIVGAILIVIACLADLIELIVDLATGGVGGWIVDVLELVIIFSILWLNGVNPIGTRQIGRWLIVGLVSFIPYLSTIAPEMVVGVILTIIVTRKEDETGRNILNKIKQKPGVVRAKRMRPLKGSPRKSDAIYQRWITRQKRKTTSTSIRSTPPPLPRSKPPELPSYLNGKKGGRLRTSKELAMRRTSKTPPPLPGKEPPPLPKTSPDVKPPPLPKKEVGGKLKSSYEAALDRFKDK
jgi:hypothetical protein